MTQSGLAARRVGRHPHGYRGSAGWFLQIREEVAMTATTQFRLVAPPQSRRTRVPATRDEQVIQVTLQPDKRLLLSVVEAAERLGIGRTLMYELLGSGQIESVHVGRLHKVPADALTAFIERQRSTV